MANGEEALERIREALVAHLGSLAEAHVVEVQVKWNDATGATVTVVTEAGNDGSE